MCHTLGRYGGPMKRARPGLGVVLPCAGLVLIAASCTLDRNGLIGDGGTVKIDAGVAGHGALTGPGSGGAPGTGGFLSSGGTVGLGGRDAAGGGTVASGGRPGPATGGAGG